MKIFVASSAPVGVTLLSRLKEVGMPIDGVITNPDKKTGRGQIVEPNAVASFVESNLISENYGSDRENSPKNNSQINVSEIGVPFPNFHPLYPGKHLGSLILPLYKPSSAIELDELLDSEKPDLVITCAYGRLIKPHQLTKPKYGWLNVHFSLLPKWRGASPVQTSLLNNDLDFGYSVFKLDEGLDTGPIYAKRRVQVDDHLMRDQILDLIAFNAGPDVWNVTCDLAGISTMPKITPEIQTDNGASYAPKISKAMGEINWNRPAQSIFNQYRALANDPDVYTFYDSNRLIIEEMSLVDHADFANKLANIDGGKTFIDQMQPGDFILLTKNASLGYVKTQTHFLEIKAVKPVGKSRVDFGTYCRGKQIKPLIIHSFKTQTK